MILLIVDGVVVINYSDIKRSNANIDFLTSHTFNTWQKNRGVEEKKDDTSLGKLAEDAVSTVLSALGIESYYSYDDFRDDNFEFHAPFDGVLCKTLDNDLVQIINHSVKIDGNKLTPEVRRRISVFGAKTVEIKSTRLAKKYKDKASFSSYRSAAQLSSLVASLKELDFLTYPFFTRYGDLSFKAYCKYANNKYLHLNVSEAELIDTVTRIEKDNSSDAYIRVFMDEESEKALIMGWIDKETFFDDPQTHKLILPGKSEVPLYFVKSIKKGYPLPYIYKIVTDHKR